MYTSYKDKLLDPRWQKRRLEILNRDKFMCQYCFSTDKTLMVHHTYYEKNIEPWEAKDDHLITLCGDCHLYFHESIKKSHSVIIDMLNRKLKDPFITGCASDLFKDVNKLHDLIYLLWELKDNEEWLINSLTAMFNNKSNSIKYECHASEA